MNSLENQIELNKSNNISSIILRNKYNIVNNDEEVDIIEKLLEENKKKGNKIPLYAIIFLLFYRAEKNTLEANQFYSLVRKEIINNKDTIIIFNYKNNIDYSIINQNNYKKKRIYDIIKDKKWLIRNVKDFNIIEYTLKLDEVPSIINKIFYFLQLCNRIKPLKEEQKNFYNSELDPFEENIVEEQKKDNSVDIIDNNKSNKILGNNKNPKENMNKYYISLEDKRKKEFENLFCIQNEESNIFYKIENEYEYNNSDLAPKYLSKKRKSDKNIIIHNDYPKLELKLKEEKTNSKSDINDKPIKNTQIDSREKKENIDSIINASEISLSFFNKNIFLGLDSNVKNSLEEGIKNINKKYMQAIQIEKNKYNEIEKELKEMKLLNKKYKEKIGLLLTYIMGSEKEEVFEKTNFPLIFNENQNYGDTSNMILVDKKDDNKTRFKYIEDVGKEYLKVNSINNNVINGDDILKKNLNDNLKIDMPKEEIKNPFSDVDRTNFLGDYYSFKNIE